MNFDVAIVGGGVIGLAIARELKRRGAGEVAVFDRGPVGREASWAAAGMLAPNLECGEVDDFHRLCTASLGLYPEFAAELLEETGIDIELDRTGTIYLAFEEDEGPQALEKCHRQIAAGIAVEQLSRNEVLKIEPLVSGAVQFGLRYPNDWQVENRKLVEALVVACRKERVSFFENTGVHEVVTESGRVTAVKTSNETIGCRQVVLAAGAWTSLLNVGGPRIPIKPIRGQMLSYSGEPGRFRHVIYSHRGYVVPRADGRLLVGATVEDVGFDTELTSDGIASLETAAREILPFIAEGEPAEKWAGLRPFAADALPAIGPVAGIDGLFAATGHYRNGILLTPVTARLAVDLLIDGRRSEYFSLFGPQRFAVPKVSGTTNL